MKWKKLYKIDRNSRWKKKWNIEEALGVFAVNIFFYFLFLEYCMFDADARLDLHNVEIVYWSYSDLIAR